MVASLQPEPRAHLGARTPVRPLEPEHGTALRRVAPRRSTTARPLSAAQVTAIRDAMRLFVDDDLARGTEPQRRAYCDGCERARPAAGFIQYERYCLCNGCATEYAVARARALVTTPGQYIRDKRFGDGDYYAL